MVRRWRSMSSFEIFTENLPPKNPVLVSRTRNMIILIQLLGSALKLAEPYPLVFSSAGPSTMGTDRKNGGQLEANNTL